MPFLWLLLREYAFAPPVKDLLVGHVLHRGSELQVGRPDSLVIAPTFFRLPTLRVGVTDTTLAVEDLGQVALDTPRCVLTSRPVPHPPLCLRVASLEPLTRSAALPATKWRKSLDALQSSYPRSFLASLG